MNTYDLDSIKVVEDFQKISINTLIEQTRKQFRLWLISNEIETGKDKITFLSSKTGFGGDRLWFSCPSCFRRVGILYKAHLNKLKCRRCLNIKYYKQRH